MLHAELLDDLGRRIAWGELPPGTVLTTSALRERHEVSRTMVREAVRVLESMRMVASRRRVGLTVQPREEWNALDLRLIGWNLAGPMRDEQLAGLMELRRAIEPVAARLAAARATAEERERLAELAERLRGLGERGLGESEAYLDTDIELHRLVLRASGNRMFAGVLGDVIGEVLAGRTRLGLSPTHPRRGALDLHDLAARAIADGDGDAAEDTIRAIVEEARDASLASSTGTTASDDDGR